MEQELQPLADKLYSLLNQRRLSICTAESITAGYLCGTIAKASGISNWLKGGLVCYNPSIKMDKLKIPPEILSVRYAVNRDVARKMAENAARFFQAQIGISTTGFAEPFENYKPEAYIGTFIAGTNRDVLHIDMRHISSREQARLHVVRDALSNLVEKITELP